MRRVLFSLIGALALATACGGSDGGPSGPNVVTLPNGTFGATVNQSAFTPAAVFMQYTGGLLGLGASDIQGRGLGFAFFVDGPGTFSVGQSAGNNASFTEGGNVWSASNNLGSGSITITVLTASRVVGSFVFGLQPVGHSAPARTMSGTFDIQLTP
jgi:hypothetical protein